MSLDTLKSFLEDNSIDVMEKGDHHHTTEGWLNVDCVYCTGQRAGKYRLGLTERSANCWQCGPKNLMRVLMDLTNQPARVCREYVNYGPAFNKEVSKRGKLVLPKGIDILLPAHEHYLKSRGYDIRKLQKLWKILSFGIHVKYAWRIFIPIILDDKVVSFTTRAIGDEVKQRYLSAPADCEVYNHKHLLYGEDYCKHRIVVCEGPLDAWKVGPGGTATFGIDFSTPQVYRIAQYPIRYICYDASPDAQRQAKKLCNELKIFPGETKNIVLEKGDPGSASKKELKQIRELLTR